MTEVNAEAAGHSRSPLLPASAAAGAPLASHAVEGGDHEEQEAHADRHGHDSHSRLGGLGGHCGDKKEEEEELRQQHPVCPTALVPPPALLTRAEVEDMPHVPMWVGGLTGDAVLAHCIGQLHGQGAAHPALTFGDRLCGLWRLGSGLGQARVPQEVGERTQCWEP